MDKKPREFRPNLAILSALEKMAASIEIVEDNKPLPLVGPDFGLCPVCGGLGVYRLDVRWDDERFGKQYPCDNPDCEKAAENRARLAEALLTRSGVPGDYARLTFESFDALPDYLRAGKQMAADVLKAMVSAAGDNYNVNIAEYAGGDDDWRNWVTLYGPLGLGKTGLVCALVNALIAIGRAPVYYRMQSLFEEIQSRYDAHRESGPAQYLEMHGIPDTPTGVLNHIRDVDFLILDEMNIPGEVSNDKLRIIEEVIRYRMGHHKATVITCNLNTTGFKEHWGARVADPVFAMAHWIELTGQRLRASARPVKSY